MSRKNDINALLERAEKILPDINKKYNESLMAKEIAADLRIDIKDFFGHLKSVLDYIAHDIVEKYCPNASPRNILYFPITPDQPSFDGTMNKSYPDLKANCPDVYSILENIQPFKKGENKWLTHFNKLNNEHKHDNLVPQTRSETKRVNVEIKGGGSVSWDSSAVKFGPGVSIGGVSVNPSTQMPVPSSTQIVTITTWVDFQFEDVNISAIWLTDESLKQIARIYSSLKAYL